MSNESIGSFQLECDLDFPKEKILKFFSTSNF